MTVTRRNTLIGLAALAVTAPVHGALPDPRRRALAALLAMRYGGSGRPVIWTMRGTRYGQIDNILTPLWTMNVFSVLRARNVTPDGFVSETLEIVVNSDLATGEPLTRWRNPYTGEDLPMRSVPVGPIAVPQTLDGPKLPVNALPGASITSTTSGNGPLSERGDDVWLRMDSGASVSRPTGRPYIVNDFAEYHASRRKIDAGGFVPATMSFVAVTGWQRWMNMGERPGGLVARAAGRKAARLADVDSEVRRAVGLVHPKIVADPVAALSRAPEAFER